ncbi:hypothetical protein KJA15_03590 [Patescibacteria group bacterium]|nr:hypothetical protein [Patescibacteria group bacterium]
MGKPKIESWKKEQESRIRNMILEELRKMKDKKVSFGQLLKQCRKQKKGLSKVTLTKHLKMLMSMGEVEKVFNAEKIRGFYRIKGKAINKLMVESWIQNLGVVAIRYIVRTKLNKPIDVDSNISDEIERYLKLEPKKDSLWSWKTLFDYVEENYFPKI